VTVTAEMVKELRSKTGAGILDCKKVLAETDGDFEAAVTALRERGMAAVERRKDRAANEGLVSSYIHGEGRIGVLIEVNCETDFVARNSEFQTFVRDVAMQVAAMGPLYVSREQIPAEAIEAEKEIYKNEALAAGKPDAIVDKIAEGKLGKLFYERVCLLDQPWVKDGDKTIGDLVLDIAAKIGENITVRRFTRYQLGEEE